MNVNKMAQQDAGRWAAAEMFFGEGAGTRRKLLWAEISDKLATIPEYQEIFDRAYRSQNMTKHAEAALAERKRIDRAAKAGKNLRAIKSGNLQNLTTGVALVFFAGYVAHEFGYDKKAYEEGKKVYKKARVEVKYRWARHKGRNVEKIFG